MHYRICHYSVLSFLLLCFCSFATSAQKPGAHFFCSDKAKNYYLCWTLVDNPKTLKLTTTSGNLKLSKQYKVFEVASVNLKNNPTSLHKKWWLHYTSFVDETNNNFECLKLKVENSGTISKELNDKYPEIVSLKGYTIDADSNTICFDYDGKLMNISIIWQGSNYLYVSYKSKIRNYYLLYKKEDSKVSSKNKK